MSQSLAKMIIYITYSTKHHKRWLNDPDTIPVTDQRAEGCPSVHAESRWARLLIL